MAEFTHFKKDGSAVMVDVHEKPDTYRAASATGTIQVSPEVFAAVRDHTAKKGDVLGVARLAGIMGAKKNAGCLTVRFSCFLLHRRRFILL